MAGEEGQMGNVGENRKVSMLLSHLLLSATGCGTLRDRRVDTQHTPNSVCSCGPEASVPGLRLKAEPSDLCHVL